MRDALRRLLELARLDDQLAALERELEQLPARRAVLEQERGQARARLEEERAGLVTSVRSQRALEATLADAESQLEHLDQQQYEVNSRDAYDALRREMAALRQSISARETEILELMERIEAAQNAIEAHETELAGREAQIEEELREHEALGERLAKDVARVRTARTELAASIERPLLEPYQRVAARRRPAAVVVSAEVCPGCRVGIPPQRYLEILAGGTLVTCGSCQRILIHEKLLEA